MIEALEHRHAGHHAQEQHQPPRPAADALLALVLVHRLEALQIVAGERLAHGSTNSSAPSGAKWRSTSASLTSRERRRLPARLVVLVDDHGAHALVEIVAMDDARHYAEFGAHARLEIPMPAAPHLRQRDFQTERRFRPHGGGGLARPFGVGAAGSRFAVERGEDVLDAFAGESSGRSPCAAPAIGPSPAGSAKAASSASTDTVPVSPSSSAPKARRGNAVGGKTRGAAHRRCRSARRSARNKCRVRPACAAGTRWRRRREKSRCRLPAWRTGKRSPATRCEPCTDTPDAAAHDQPVDQRDVGLAEILDRHVERIFVAPELQRLVVAAGLAEIVERADVAAGRECALAGGLDHHARDRRVVGPSVKLRAQAPPPWRG